MGTTRGRIQLTAQRHTHRLPAIHEPNKGDVNVEKIVPLANGGFAAVFAVVGFIGSSVGEDWEADFFDSAGNPTATNVVLVPRTNTGGSRAGYPDRDVIATATPDGGLLLVLNYNNDANHLPPGRSPEADATHQTFPAQEPGARPLLAKYRGSLTTLSSST